MTLNPFDPGVGLRVVRARGSTRRDADPNARVYGLTLNPEERRRLGVARGALPVGTFARNAVRAALGLPALAPPTGRQGAGLPPRHITFYLSPAERAAVDAARKSRTLAAWLRDAVRVGAGLRNNPWSPCADSFLRMRFRRADRAELAAALPGRTWASIHVRAQHLGLELPLPDGLLTIRQAAAVSGYDGRTVARMLAAAGITPRRLAGGTAAAQRPRRFVTRAELDRAQRLYEASEPVSIAAARRGVCRVALARALARLGHARPADARYWRAPTEVIDQAVREIRGAGESLYAAARRTRTAVSVLRAWLCAAGLLAGRARQYHALDPAAVERVVRENRARMTRGQRRCRRCGELGHYRTTCPAAREAA